MAEPTEARRKRAQAREHRRSQSKPDRADGDGVGDEAGGDQEQPLEALLHAAKVAAAGAAVGAAAAAARAFTSQSEGDEEPDLEEPEPEEQEETAPSSETQPEEPDPSRSDAGQEEEKPTMVAESRPETSVRGASPDDAGETVRRAREQLEALLERSVENVSSFERTRDGWLVTLEVVEVSRIPESTDVLASYEMELDDGRNLRRYARIRRYHRSQADGGGR